MSSGGGECSSAVTEQTVGDISEESMVEGSGVTEDEAEGGLSDDDASVYPIDELGKFLVRTKGMRNVNVEEFFPDRNRFLRSIRESRAAGLLTLRKSMRLKK